MARTASTVAAVAMLLAALACAAEAHGAQRRNRGSSLSWPRLTTASGANLAKAHVLPGKPLKLGRSLGMPVLYSCMKQCEKWTELRLPKDEECKPFQNKVDNLSRQQCEEVGEIFREHVKENDSEGQNCYRLCAEIVGHAGVAPQSYVFSAAVLHGLASSTGAAAGKPLTRAAVTAAKGGSMALQSASLPQEMPAELGNLLDAYHLSNGNRHEFVRYFTSKDYLKLDEDEDADGEGEGEGDADEAGGEGEAEGEGEGEGAAEGEGEGEAEGSASHGGEGEAEGSASHGGEGEGSASHSGEGEGEGAVAHQAKGEGEGEGEGAATHQAKGEGEGEGEGAAKVVQAKAKAAEAIKAAQEATGEASASGEGESSGEASASGEGEASASSGEGEGEGEESSESSGEGEGEAEASGEGEAEKKQKKKRKKPAAKDVWAVAETYNGDVTKPKSGECTSLHYLGMDARFPIPAAHPLAKYFVHVAESARATYEAASFVPGVAFSQHDHRRGSLVFDAQHKTLGVFFGAERRCGRRVPVDRNAQFAGLVALPEQQTTFLLDGQNPFLYTYSMLGGGRRYRALSLPSFGDHFAGFTLKEDGSVEVQVQFEADDLSQKWQRRSGVVEDLDRVPAATNDALAGPMADLAKLHLGTVSKAPADVSKIKAERDERAQAETDLGRAAAVVAGKVVAQEKANAASPPGSAPASSEESSEESSSEEAAPEEAAKAAAKGGAAAPAAAASSSSSSSGDTEAEANAKLADAEKKVERDLEQDKKNAGEDDEIVPEQEKAVKDAAAAGTGSSSSSSSSSSSGDDLESNVPKL